MKRYLAIALSMLLTSSFAASTSEKVINSTGGNSASDGLRIYIGNKSNVQVVAYSDFSTGATSTPQLSDFSNALATNPTATDVNNGLYLILEDSSNEYSFGQANLYGTPTADFNPISQTMSKSSVVTVIEPDFSAVAALSSIDAPTITITDTYTMPDRYYTRKINITGLPVNYTAKLAWVVQTSLKDSSSSPVETLSYADHLRTRGSYIPGSTTNGYTDTLAVVANDTYQSMTSLAPAWSHFQTGSGYAFTPYGALGGFADIFSPYQSNMTQIGVEWGVPTGDTSYSTEVQHGFYNEPQYVTALYKESKDIINTGDLKKLEIDITNLGLNDISDATFDYTLDPQLEFVSYDGAVDQYSCLSTPVVSSTDGQTINFSNVSVANPVYYRASSHYANASQCILEITVKVVAAGNDVSGNFSNLGTLTEKKYLYLDDPINEDDRGNVLNLSSSAGVETGAVAVPSMSLYSVMILISLLLGLGLCYRRR